MTSLHHAPRRTKDVFEGGCHCGEIRFELHWPESSRSIPARRCSCSFCTRIGGTWTSHPDAKLLISGAGPRQSSHYRFDTGTADFVFCKRCGVTLFAICELEGSDLAVVNILTLDQGQDFELDRSDSCFDGESREERLSRRRQNWIGRVEFLQGVSD